jgi:VIT1/CCC1 family predicted Fe2+/Mn2+ transporter
MDNQNAHAYAVASQSNELTDHFIYLWLAKQEKDGHNREVLNRMAQEEYTHFRFWAQQTKASVTADRIKLLAYLFVIRVFGLTFGLKLMERGEKKTQEIYMSLVDSVPIGLQTMINDEERHEHELISMVNEEKLKYVSAVVLGLNDALVELTGALSGFTLALASTKLVLAAGLVTGIAGSLSMAAAQYMSARSDQAEKNPAKSAVYTGLAFLATMIFLIFPYTVFGNIFVCLGMVVLNAVIVVLVFTFYISVAKDLPFKKRFLEMAFISFGVALVTFSISALVRRFLHIDV